MTFQLEILLVWMGKFTSHIHWIDFLVDKGLDSGKTNNE